MATENELDELRLRIARARGWAFPVAAEMDYLTRHYGASGEIPDWPRDIAAAWELESEIPKSEHANYCQFLANIIEPDETLNLRWWDLVHATPEQRCRAWLAWKESANGN